MNSNLLLPSVLFFIATSASAGLVPDTNAHRACQERLQSVSHAEQLNLRTGPTYEAPQPAAGRYLYYINATSHADGTRGRDYRIECEARQIGRIQRFTLEPGRWRYDSPEAYAVR